MEEKLISKHGEVITRAIVASLRLPLCADADVMFRDHLQSVHR
jgi:hypothetical protein